MRKGRGGLILAWFYRGALLLVLVGLLAYFLVMRPGRFQIVPLHRNGFIVIDTISGSYELKERGLVESDPFRTTWSWDGSTIPYRFKPGNFTP
jgi:hypothetical protein